MFDSMRVTNQIVPKRQLVKRKEDEESKKQTTEAEKESSNGSNLAQSRGLQYVSDLQNGKKPAKAPQQFNNNYAYNNQVQNVRIARNTNVTTPIQQNRIQQQNYQVQNRSVTTKQPVQTQQTEATSSYLATHSPKINIAQVIGDFKNTAHAIGTPEEIFDEVRMYLELVEKQTKKDNANVKMIQSNLRNAASLLDNYISDTLNKTSKVVENWVEAIFLQQVDYKYNEKDVNEAFLVKMPEDKKAPEQTENVDTNTTQTPQKPSMDSELKMLFLDGKSAAKKNDTETALSTFEKAINRSIEIGDTNTQAKLCFEVGKVFDKENNLPKALENYNKAIDITNDNNIKVQAHYSMAQIYDDVNQFKPAIEHYMAAISFAGETENFKAQTKSLTKIGNIYTDKYDKTAFNVYDDAKTVAEESKDSMIKGYVSSTIANAYNKFNKPTKALRYYSDAVKNYASAGANEKVAINYKHAGELLQDYQKGEKGKVLIRKAIAFAKKAENQTLIDELEAQLVM